MITINFNQCLTSFGQVKAYGQFTRSRVTLPQPKSSQTVRVLRDIRPPATFGSLVFQAEKGQLMRLALDEARIHSFQSGRGWLVEQGGRLLLLPVSPRLLLIDSQARIQRWDTPDWQVRQEAKQVIVQIFPTRAGPMELVWAELEPDISFETLFSHPAEQENWAVEGCWSRLQGPADFWRFLALGNIYSGRFAAYGRFPSAQTGWSLYKIASVLAGQSGNPFYTHLMAQLAYSALAALNDEGVWPNGEWLAEAETHLRFQLDGIHLLLSAYGQFGDAALLTGAERAAGFVLTMKDELAGGGWWFLHDTLELDEPLLSAKYPAYYRHRAFGKRPANTLTLNTHLSALHVLHRLADVSQNRVYQEAYANGLQTLQQMLTQPHGRVVHALAEKLLETSFENKPASPLRRGWRALVRSRIAPRLTVIQQFWPGFITAGGYLWRDMSLPAWGYWYHLVNLYDLLLLYRLDPQPWLRVVIDRAMAFSQKSNLIDYLLAQQHYIAPQWLQILKAYGAIAPQFDPQLLPKESARLQTQGYGLPPELYTPGGTFLTCDTLTFDTLLTADHRPPTAEKLQLKGSQPSAVYGHGAAR